jgi:hypothetical protein
MSCLILLQPRLNVLTSALNSLPGALHAIKRAIHAADTLSFEQAREAEMAAFASRWGGEDNKQALKKR